MDSSESTSSDSEEEEHGVVEEEDTEVGSVIPAIGTVSSRANAAAELVDEEQNREDWNTREIDGLICPICFEAWSTEGDHQVCCLPCGHIYGSSCIKKWLSSRGSSKCPQCKKKCAIKDVRVLYASQVVAVDGALQKAVQSLEAKCDSLEKKNADLSTSEVQWKKREADLNEQLRYLKQRTEELENLLEETERKASESTKLDFGGNATPNFNTQGCANNFILQSECQVNGARLFDIDVSSQMFVIARRLSGSGGINVLTKMSFNHSYQEDIQLPASTKAVKDLRVSPHDKLVLLATLGKKLSVLSTVSNNTVLNYNLPAAAWSCTWDISDSHYVYAGLQDGRVMQFDSRYTAGPVEILTGLFENLIHSVHSFSSDSSLSPGVKSVLTASSPGLCHWIFGRGEERPYLIPGSENEGVCISLAHSPITDEIVASYRPKISLDGSLEQSQPTSTSSGGGVWGSQFHFRKTDSIFKRIASTSANVNNVRLTRSAIVDGMSRNSVFASADEATCVLSLQELPSLMSIGHLKPRKYPIHDVKYSRTSSSGLLGCLSEDTLQLFTANLV